MDVDQPAAVGGENGNAAGTGGAGVGEGSSVGNIRGAAATGSGSHAAAGGSGSGSAGNMDTSPTSDGVSVMAASGTAGSITTSVHPLVIMNISEHWTRNRAQNDGKIEPVLGAIIGQHRGRHLEIMNSFELVFTVIDGLTVIDRDYYKTKEEQFKQVFSHMDFLGWYTTGDAPTPADVHVHKQICEIYESPVLLKLNPLTRHSDLPIGVYESIIDIVNGETTMLFVQLPYVLATEEAERIGVDHVARMSSAENMDSSLVAEHLMGQHSAIKMLHSRVKLILEYVKAAQRGEVPVCHEALRLAYSLCHRLPVIQEDRFKPEFYRQYCDVSLITYLGMITKGCEEVHQFITRFNLLHEKHAVTRRTRPRGIFPKAWQSDNGNDIGVWDLTSDTGSMTYAPKQNTNQNLNLFDRNGA